MGFEHSCDDVTALTYRMTYIRACGFRFIAIEQLTGPSGSSSDHRSDRGKLDEGSTRKLTA